MLEINKIYNQDCLLGMKDIDDESIDCIICDLPYGTTMCKWDSIIPFDLLWEHYKRIIKKNGAIVLFGQEPFSSQLRLSNLEMYKYDWIWNKGMSSNFMMVKYTPLKTTEQISVFSKGGINQNTKNKMVYYPQGVVSCDKIFNRNIKKEGVNLYNCLSNKYNQTQTNYPINILNFKSDEHGLHPTQKPVSLIRYLIRTYTQENELVLDNCMGSGTTAIACMKENRNFIGFELDKEYYDIAQNRISKITNKTKLF